MTDTDLIALAVKAQENAYAPYSNFHVGAALLCADGTVFCGCNVENSSFGATVCAERNAFFAAIADGRKKGDFLSIAVTGGKNDNYCLPCGVCRQVMTEFCNKNFEIILYNGTVKKYTLDNLLPHSFELK